MYGWEIWMQLRHYLERGVSKAELVRRFGVSRRTIHRWVESGQLDVDLSSCEPAVKTLDQFDFSFQPSIKREQIESLHELGFLQRAENVILLGPPGVGKTHLAISLATPAAVSGRKVYYGTLAALIESLTEAKAAGNRSRRLRVLTHPALLVVDEIGYLPISQDGAVLFFQLINARHERASTVLTSRPPPPRHKCAVFSCRKCAVFGCH